MCTLHSFILETLEVDEVEEHVPWEAQRLFNGPTLEFQLCILFVSAVEFVIFYQRPPVAQRIVEQGTRSKSKVIMT